MCARVILEKMGWFTRLGLHECFLCTQDLLYVATPGEFCGVLSALTGEPSFITVMAAVHSYLIAITKTNLYQ